MKLLRKSMEEINKLGNYPRIDTIKGPIGSKIIVNNEEYLLFSSNNYLSLTTHQRMKQAAIEAINKYGTGSGASRVVAGTIDLHTKLEKEIAEFKIKESGMVMSSGYSTNVSLIPALANVFSIHGKKQSIRTLIFSDELNHASIIDGIRLSGVEVIKYHHKDMKFLEKMLEKYSVYRKIIITDSIFSMDGDFAPLDEIVNLKKKYNTMLFIDEAHATGVIGKNGRGIADYFNVTDDVDVIMGTFSKGLGSIGAYVVSDEDIIKLMKVTVRGYVFSTALPPGDIAVNREAIKILNENPNFGKELQEKSKYLRDSLNDIGFSTLGSQSQIIPILIGDIMRALEFQMELRKKKIIAPCIQWPAVARDKSRIRFSVMLAHTKSDIDELVSACKEVKNNLQV